MVDECMAHPLQHYTNEDVNKIVVDWCVINLGVREKVYKISQMSSELRPPL